MELTNPKILIASDGRKTYVIANGTPVVCEEFTFSADGIDVTASAKNVNLTGGFTAEQFEDFVKNNLGYQIRA